MTDSLILDSLEIHNFRAFEHLLIEKLGRVNLIVGKNNVGKTCVLEALQLYASCGSWATIQEIMQLRNEFYNIHDDDPDSDAHKKKALIKYLFYKVTKTTESLRDKLFIKIISTKEADKLLKVLERRRILKTDPPKIEKVEELIKAIMIDNSLYIYSQLNKTQYVFVSDKGISQWKSSMLWNNVYLTDFEDDVINILRIIEPNVKSIGFVDNLQEESNRVPKVRLATSKTPVLLSSLGEGMNRLLGIALALVNSKDGFLLVDEIDNGIHYSVLPDLWRLIFEGAKKMNVQVFATTHRWDCIEAFQQAATESGTDDGMLISLRQKKKTPGHVVGFIFEGKDLEIITRDRIEVR